MFTVLLTIHVVLAVFLIGPVAVIPMTALRSVRQRDAAAVRGGARQTAVFGFGSILVFLFGFGVMGSKPDWFSFSDLWLLVSVIAYVVAIVLVLALVVPDLRRAARAIEADPVDEARLGALRGRLSAVAGLASLLFLFIVVLMVARPF
ncbi:hypothetical protein Athai_05500 [Actinocatenispora thailandica]|uniref:DUF2269 domain-containing protein n=1 Tax=Actinocatenispora thailandica TaxID=227318 RepID=A0A7R7DKF3_9ACTN|nr:DUF2269 family protein [Actinocatenispora thailandica]BCJ33047.1 hypothetical protein Athai_05500 [Actinocatenispora thailandica]